MPVACIDRDPTARRGLCPRLLFSVTAGGQDGTRHATAGGAGEGRGEVMGVAERVDSMASPLCERVGVELVDVEYEGGVLRLTIDHVDGVGMDAIASVTREVSRALDHEDPIGGTYTLEVSSPGLERSLKRPTHFERAVGDQVMVKTCPGIEGDRRVSGVLETADATGITVRSADGEVRCLRHDEILQARTVFDWSPDARSTGRVDGRARADRASAPEGLERKVGR